MMYGSNLDPSLARFFVDSEDVIDSLKLMLQGKDIDYQFDPPKMVDFGDPMMNNYGIGRVLAKLKMAHKGIPLSNFHQETPYIFARLQSYTIARELFVHMTEYGIKNEDDMMKIIELVLVSLFAIYSRPVKEGERKFYKGFARESHVIGREKQGKMSLT